MIGVLDVTRFSGCLLGLACGDAVGTTVEFQGRGTFEPVTDMVGGGPFRLRPGEWTDDTSMALCLGESLLESRGFDPTDQMQRFCRWWKEGYWSSNGSCFDIGNTVRDALSRFLSTGESFAGSTHPRSAGNGSIMRLAPIPMFFYPDSEAAIRFAGESSRTTHGAAEAVDACRVLAAVLIEALGGSEKEEVLRAGHRLVEDKDLAPAIRAIAEGEYLDKESEAISASGYVVHSLEASLWCFARTASFEEAVLEAVNLGDDADTTAAITGQIAGAHYGLDGIPKSWLETLVMRDSIARMAAELMAARPA